MICPKFLLVLFGFTVLGSKVRQDYVVDDPLPIVMVYRPVDWLMTSHICAVG